MFKKKFVWIAIVVIVMIPILGLAFKGALAYRTGLAAPLKLEVQATQPAPTVRPGIQEATVQATATQAPVAQAGTCGNSGAMTVLFLSRDIYEGQYPAGNVWPYGSDVIRLARVDFSNQTVRIISIPRDLGVATPHLANLNIAYSPLGLVFYRIEQNTTGSKAEQETAATNAVAQVLYDNFGVVSDHYILYDMYQFADVVDDLGGLDINVPSDFSASGISFHAGQQHMDGKTALNYARLMNGPEINNGWDRFSRQNLVMISAWNKLLEPANLGKIPGLVEEYGKDAVTDLSPAQIVDLSCLATKLTRDQIILTGIDQSMVTGPGPETSMLPDIQKITAFLARAAGSVGIPAGTELETHTGIQRSFAPGARCPPEGKLAGWGPPAKA